MNVAVKGADQLVLEVILALTVTVYSPASAKIEEASNLIEFEDVVVRWISVGVGPIVTVTS